jgi:hypothetical protein
MPQARLAILGANERPVIYNHRNRATDLSRDGQGEVVAPSGNQRNLNSAARGFRDGGLVRFGHLPSAVQKCAVNIQRNQTHRHALIVPRNLASPSPVILFAEKE